MIEPLLVGVGGAIGAVCRYLVGIAIGAGEFPIETLTVNVVGSFTIALVTFAGAGRDMVLIIGVGACGAFTTFSSFSVDTVRLREDGRSILAGGYALANVLLATEAVALAALPTV